MSNFLLKERHKKSFKAQRFCDKHSIITRQLCRSQVPWHDNLHMESTVEPWVTFKPSFLFISLIALKILQSAWYFSICTT